MGRLGRGSEINLVTHSGVDAGVFCSNRLPLTRPANVRHRNVSLDWREPSIDMDGNAMIALVEELFPICRSITGNGVRQTPSPLHPAAG
jgi:hypothetical protein